jgi:hypothetical protein
MLYCLIDGTNSLEPTLVERTNKILETTFLLTLKPLRLSRGVGQRQAELYLGGGNESCL